MQKKSVIIIITMIGFLFCFRLAFGQELYRWVDEKGIVHFTDDLTLVPEQYRGQLQQKTPSKEPSKEPSASPSPSSSPSPSPSPSPFRPPTPSGPGEPSKTMEPVREIPEGREVDQKDMLGRGEEWWRATVKDWNQKFLTYRTNYENAYNQWKAKEQELEESKFKPDSLKRKLKSEIQVLEDKAKDWEKQMNEAKDMIENVLPKQARDYRANPEWLKIEGKK